jgi:hypothetical protein
MIRIVAALGVIPLTAIAIGLAACNESAEPQAPGETASPASTADVEQRLLLYRERIGERSTENRTTPIWRIVLYDLAAGRELWSFDVGDDDDVGDVLDDVPAQAMFGGERIAVNLERRVVLYSLDGRQERELYRVEEEDAHVIGVTISPDGGKVAMTAQTVALCPPRLPGADTSQCREFSDITQILVFDAETGRELLRVPQSNAGFDGFVGQAYPVGWRDDGEAFIVGGHTYSEQPGGRAEVALDGTVETRNVPEGGTLSPTGRHAWTTPGAWYCDLRPALTSHVLQIVELETGGTLTRVQYPGLNVAPYEWSPGGRELLYSTYRLVTDTSPEATPDSCLVEDDASRQWYVLSVEGAAVQQVADAAEARRAWYGDRLIEYRCNGEIVRVPVGRDPYCIADNGAQAAFDVLHGGTVITPAADFAVIGYPEWTPPR